MSTRTNIRIRSKGEQVQLYRHGDGYPTSVLPSLLRARELAGNSWQSARAGKVAGFICAEGYSPPRSFGSVNLPASSAYEPEPDLRLHGDIEWLYIVDLIDKDGGLPFTHTEWMVMILVPNMKFWDDPRLANTRFVTRGTIEELAAIAADIEDRAYVRDNREEVR